MMTLLILLKVTRLYSN